MDFYLKVSEGLRSGVIYSWEQGIRARLPNHWLPQRTDRSSMFMEGSIVRQLGPTHANDTLQGP